MQSHKQKLCKYIKIINLINDKQFSPVFQTLRELMQGEKTKK
jgi:hypothetical protein